MFWTFETLTSKTCHCTKWLFSVAVAWWAGRVTWCNSSYQLWFLFLFHFWNFFSLLYSNLKNVDGKIWTGNFKSIPCRARPFLLSYWIAVSVTQLETGIYYDSMTPNKKKHTPKKIQVEKKNQAKKLKKKSGGRVERIYMEGLSKYVSNGCEDNVVLNIVITF